ncbi:hypothetical protein LEN26_013620 [Aphanomyces euteiches]|nr:hypothetical protein LEN26_013620 [Aphanomyces euteiches]KAH9168496.1 hypothetical protein AeNC1_017916 [Aphanomyces euteiches]
MYARPSLHGEDYYSRKGYYGMAGMVICDDMKRIRFLDLGWPGAVHDMRVWSNSKIATKPWLYFSHLQFLLADSGYMLCDFLVPSYKRTRGSQLSQEQLNFNTRLAQCRSVNEHFIGLLKGFQSLRGMRMDISKKSAAKTMIMYIRCASILHNLLLDMSDPSDDWDFEIQDYDETNDRFENEESSNHGYSCTKDRRQYHTNMFSI